MNAEIDDDLMRKARSEYMRRYRAKHGGLVDADKANHRAQAMAITWVRTHKPELWREFLDEAWKYIRP